MSYFSFPTCVGVTLAASNQGCCKLIFPRSGGGYSEEYFDISEYMAFSPRMWGNSSQSAKAPPHGALFA